VTAAEIGELVALVGLPVLAVAVIAYVLLMPERAQMVAGWIWSLISKVWRGTDRKAVALRVQGHVNASAKSIQKQIPDGVIEGKLKVKWSTSEEAQAVLRDGDVIVFMKRSRHHEENVARALMVYLPKAVLPRARRYVEKPTMAAVDLTVAKIILGRTAASQGVLDVFYEQHLDPACEDDAILRKKVTEMDEIDLHGWLLRVLLPEFRRLGNQLHPAQPERRCEADAEAFARWLYGLAARRPGDIKLPLSYEGSYLRVALVFVAHGRKLAEQGIDPYRKRAKSLVYSGRYDAVYLMARDQNMWAVHDIVERLAQDGRVDSMTCHEFRLRPDFKKRRFDRRNAVVACLVPHNRAAFEPPEDETDDIQIERFTPPIGDDDEGTGRERFFEREPGALAVADDLESPRATDPSDHESLR
jgi:hypothetical protein